MGISYACAWREVLHAAGKLDTYCIRSALRPASSRVFVATRSHKHATFHESRARIGAIVQRPLCVSCSNRVQVGQVIDMTATAQQMRLFNDDANAKTSPASFGLGRLLGVGLVLLLWVPIGLMIRMLL
jgi:LPS sulfotransferase NodH